MVKISATRLIKIMRDNFRNIIIEFVITEMAMLIKIKQRIGLNNQQRIIFFSEESWSPCLWNLSYGLIESPMFILGDKVISLFAVGI